SRSSSSSIATVSPRAAEICGASTRNGLISLVSRPAVIEPERRRAYYRPLTRHNHRGPRGYWKRFTETLNRNLPSWLPRQSDKTLRALRRYVTKCLVRNT